MTRPTSGAPSWWRVSRRMSMYQSASRPEESVTFPCTTARSTISSSRRSRSGREAPFQGPAPRDEGRGGTGSFSMRPTLLRPPLAGPTRSGCGLRHEHLVDDVDGGVGGLHVAADDRRRLPGDGLLAGDGEALPRPLDGHRVVVQRAVLTGQLVRPE